MWVVRAQEIDIGNIYIYIRTFNVVAYKTFRDDGNSAVPSVLDAPRAI